jgi:hypothetical protein
MEHIPPMNEIGMVAFIVWFIVITLDRTGKFMTEQVWPWFTVQVGLRTEQQVESARHREEQHHSDVRERHQRFMEILERAQEIQIKFEATMAIMNDRLGCMDDAILRLSESIDRFGFRMETIEQRMVNIERDQHDIRDAMMAVITNTQKSKKGKAADESE